MNQLDRQRMFYVMQRIGCLCCRRRGYAGIPCDAHHPNIGGHAGNKRRGDDVVVGICPWHHRGVPRGGFTKAGMRLLFGPSLALEPAKFREEFGDDDFLIAEQARLNEQYREISL